MTFLILTEGGKNYGFGHISRCISFYDELCLMGYEVTIIIDGDDTVSSIINRRKYLLLNWLNNIALLNNHLKDNSFLLLDSIQAKQSDIDYLLERINNLTVIDDYCRRNYKNTVIIDWTVNVENTNKHIHNLFNENTLLLGLKYSVLRKAFLSKSNFRINPFKNILITMGGSDIRSLSIPILEHFLMFYPDFNYTVIISSFLEERKKYMRNANVTFLERLDDSGMKHAMESSDLVITAGGQTLYELATIGVPAIAIQVIDNQKEDLNGFFEQGTLIDVISWNDPKLFEKLIKNITSHISEFSREKYTNAAARLGIGNGLRSIIEVIEKRYYGKN